MISTKMSDEMRTYSQTSDYNCQNTNILFDTQEVPEFKIHRSKFNILLTDPYWYLCDQWGIYLIGDVDGGAVQT